MSAYTTTPITRTSAKAALVRAVMLESTDEQLERMIDEMIFERRLRRCQIVQDDEQNEDQTLG